MFELRDTVRTCSYRVVYRSSINVANQSSRCFMKSWNSTTQNLLNTSPVKVNLYRCTYKKSSKRFCVVADSNMDSCVSGVTHVDMSYWYHSLVKKEAFAQVAAPVEWQKALLYWSMIYCLNDLIGSGY